MPAKAGTHANLRKFNGRRDVCQRQRRNRLREKRMLKLA
jgi:hypothetical protein